MADTIVEVRDSAGVERLAPLFFVSPGQINYLMPPGTVNGTATVTVTNGAGAVSLGNVTIANVAPGLFTANTSGLGVPAALVLRVKANGTQSFEPVARFDSAQNLFVPTPIDLGPDLEIPAIDCFDSIRHGWRYSNALSAVMCSIGGVNAEVLFAGAQGVQSDWIGERGPAACAEGARRCGCPVDVDGKAANTCGQHQVGRGSGTHHHLSFPLFSHLGRFQFRASAALLRFPLY